NAAHGRLSQLARLRDAQADATWCHGGGLLGDGALRRQRWRGVNLPNRARAATITAAGLTCVDTFPDEFPGGASNVCASVRATACAAVRHGVARLGASYVEGPMTTVFGIAAGAVFFIVLLWFAVREARKHRELEAQLTPEELMKKRAIEGP